MKADRVVLDTNVLISAVVTQTGPPRRVVDLARADIGVLLFSETLAELRHRIPGSKFDRYVGRESRAAFGALPAAVAEWTPIAGARLGCRDPTDDKILETVLTGRAPAIWSRETATRSPCRRSMAYRSSPRPAVRLAKAGPVLAALARRCGLPGVPVRPGDRLVR